MSIQTTKYGAPVGGPNLRSWETINPKYLKQGGGGMDPATAGIIMGGADFLSGLLGGPSESEKAAMMQAKLAERAYNDSRMDQRRALGFGEAQLQAKQALRNQLMQRMAGMGQKRTDLSSLFASTRNPFGGGVAGSGVVSNITPFEIDPAALAPTELPAARPAAPRVTSGRGGPIGRAEEEIQRRLNAIYAGQGGY